MVIRITVEAIVYSLLYTAFMLVLFRIQGAKYQLYNYPPAIKARAIEKGITTQAELDAHAKKNILIAEAFVLCIAFGQICAVLQMRYGKKGIAVGIIVTVAVVMGIGAGFIMGSDLADTLTAWFQGQSGSVISMGLLIGAVVAAALYAVSLVMMLRVVSKYEVRV